MHVGQAAIKAQEKFLYCLETFQVYPQLNRFTVTNFFFNIDIILSNFSFSRPIESLQTCVSLASLCHHRGSHTIM